MHSTYTIVFFLSTAECDTSFNLLLGWGTEGFNIWGTAKSPEFLQQANVPVVDSRTCAQKAGSRVHDATMVCIGGKGQVACHGDRYCNRFSLNESCISDIIRRIRSMVDAFSAQRIYQTIIMPIFTYCGYNSLGWSESRKRMIRSIENRSLEIISPKCSLRSCDPRILSINNFLQKRACSFVFDCLNGTVCSPYKNYFERWNHNAANTKNNGKTAKLPKVKLDFARRSFYFKGASIFNSLPLKLKNINSRLLFRKALDDFHLLYFIVVF